MLVEREAGRRSEMKNAGLGTGMAGGIKVLWDQVLLTGGNIRKFGLGAEPGEGCVDALLEGDFWTSEHSIGFVHWGDVGAAGGRSAG